MADEREPWGGWQGEWPRDHREWLARWSGVAGAGLVALDVGAKRTGVATSDRSYRLATPLGILDHTRGHRRVWEQWRAWCSEHHFCAVVLGKPVIPSGQMTTELVHAGELRARDFLARYVPEDWPVLWVDERGSSRMADRYLRESGLSRRERTEHHDTMAARILLQEVLDYGVPPLRG